MSRKLFSGGMTTGSMEDSWVVLALIWSLPLMLSSIAWFRSLFLSSLRALGPLSFLVFGIGLGVSSPWSGSSFSLGHLCSSALFSHA